MLVDPVTGRLQQGLDLSELPEQFYAQLNSLIETAMSLTKAHAVSPSRQTRLGNLETLREGISHASLVRHKIALRRRRDELFPYGLFADPAWDILLDLYGAHIAQHRVPVSSLCIAAAVPATTALRWIGNLEKQGLVARRSDPHDGRRVFIELTDKSLAAMEVYFDEVGRVSPVAS